MNSFAIGAHSLKTIWVYMACWPNPWKPFEFAWTLDPSFGSHANDLGIWAQSSNTLWIHMKSGRRAWSNMNVSSGRMAWKPNELIWNLGSQGMKTVWKQMESGVKAWKLYKSYDISADDLKIAWVHMESRPRAWKPHAFIQNLGSRLENFKNSYGISAHGSK